MRPRAKLAATLLALLPLPAVTVAADLHRLWDDRCTECHGHAGEFARRFLTVVDGELRGRHQDRDLRQFLQNHYFKNSEIEPVLAMLLAQVSSEPLFKERCLGCHGTASELARQSLELREGIVYVRRSGQPVSEFLRHHAGLQEPELAFFADLLARVTRETER